MDSWNPESAEHGPDALLCYKKIAEIELRLHVFRPPACDEASKCGAIVFFFGGGWRTGTPLQFYPQSKRLASLGMISMCAEYRIESRHGTSPWESVADAKSVMRWVRKNASRLGIDPERIAAGGGSAGGHLAAATAFLSDIEETGAETSVDCRPNALVLYNPVVDNSPDGFGYERVAPEWRCFSPLHNLKGNCPPSAFFLGKNDSLVPEKVGRMFKAKVESQGGRCDLFLYDGQSHGFFNEAKYDDTISKTEIFLESLGFLDVLS